MNTSVKTERRSLCMVDYDIPVNKCVKRRRRSPPAVVVNDNNIGQQLDSPKANQNIVQTPTVKRSSRFRGVSRYYVL